MNKEVSNLQKDLFSKLHSEYDKLIYNLNKPKQKLTISQISMISSLNKDLLSLTNSLEKINFSLLKNKKKEITKREIETLENFDKDEKSIKAFLPFIMYYRMMLDSAL